MTTICSWVSWGAEPSGSRPPHMLSFLGCFFVSQWTHSFLPWAYVWFYLCIWNSHRTSPVSLDSCTAVNPFANLSHSYGQSVDSLRARTTPEIPGCHCGALRTAEDLVRESSEATLLRNYPSGIPGCRFCFRVSEADFCFPCVPSPSPVTFHLGDQAS